MWKDIPDEIGDWLWVTIMPCNCCVDQCGVCFVTPYQPNGKNWEQLSNDLYLSYEGHKPPDRPKPKGWLKIRLPG